MSEAATCANQLAGAGDHRVSALAACQAHQMVVMASVPLAEGDRLTLSSTALKALFPETHTAAQAALQFSRSAPGVTTAVVGTTSIAHLRENLELSHMSCATLGMAEVIAETKPVGPRQS